MATVGGCSPSTALDGMGRIHICIRATLDWQDRALVEGQILACFRSKLDAWNATFDMPYHLFRQRVHRIAQLNLDRVEGATYSAMERVPSDHLIVPVDDDDWFAPDLAERLRKEFDPSVRGYLWSCHVIEPPRRIRSSFRRIAGLLGRPDRFICGTNNYAVVSTPGLRHLALNHVKASRHFDARPSDIKRIPATLAIQNRTLASQTTLAWNRPSIRREELVILLSRYRDLYSSWKLPPSLSWAKPYVDMMAELMQSIRAK